MARAIYFGNGHGVLLFLQAKDIALIFNSFK